MTGFEWGSASDVGRVRKANEDSMLTVDGLFVVADGMGGHRGGAVASKVAVESVAKSFTDRTTEGLVGSVEDANAAIVERSAADSDLEGMGTTLCALALVEGAEHFDGRDLLAVVNVGDSRLYLLKEGALEQITEDHSLVATLERQGRLTRAEAAVHPQRNVLTRALGIDERVMVDSWEIVPFVGDRYLLCSDGLFNEVDEHRIEATLRKLSDPGEAAHELVRLANEHGGRDNVTCVVVDIIDGAGDDLPPVDGDGRIASAIHGPERVLTAAQGPEAALPSRGGDGSSDGAIAGGDRSDPGVDAEDPDAEMIEIRRTTRLTWRVVVFALAFIAVIAAVIGSVVYAGTSTYYVGFDQDQVTIYQGRPGGVLWIEPRVVEHSRLTRDDVPAAYVADMEAGREQPSMDAARRYIENIEELSRQVRPSDMPPPTVSDGSDRQPSQTPGSDPETAEHGPAGGSGDDPVPS